MRIPPMRCWFFILVCVVPRCASAAEARAAVYTSEELRQQLKLAHDRIRAWSIEYQAAAEGIQFYGHRILAAQFPDGCYYRGAKGTANFDWKSGDLGVDWRNDTFQDWVLVTGTQCSSGLPANREYLELPWPPDSPLPAKLERQVIWVALGWWPFERRPAPEANGGPCVIPAIVESSEYAVAPQQQKRGDRCCHVLEDPGRDRIWIDCERDYAFVGRELYDLETGSTIQRLELTGHRELSPGVWVPSEIRSILFDHHARTPEARRRRIIEVEIRLVDVRLNEQVAESLFEPEPLPAGAVRTFRDGRYQQVTAGGFEHMDLLAERVRRMRSLDQRPDPASGATRDLAVIAAAATAIFVLGIARRRTTPAEPLRE